MGPRARVRLAEATCPPELSPPSVKLFPMKQQRRKLQKYCFLISVLPQSLTSSLILLRQQAANQKLFARHFGIILGSQRSAEMLNSSPSTHLPLSSGLTALMWSNDRSQLMLSGPATIAPQGKRRLALTHPSHLELEMHACHLRHSPAQSSAPSLAPGRCPARQEMTREVLRGLVLVVKYVASHPSGC